MSRFALVNKENNKLTLYTKDKEKNYEIPSLIMQILHGLGSTIIKTIDNNIELIDCDEEYDNNNDDGWYQTNYVWFRNLFIDNKFDLTYFISIKQNPHHFEYIIDKIFLGEDHAFFKLVNNTLYG